MEREALKNETLMVLLGDLLYPKATPKMVESFGKLKLLKWKVGHKTITEDKSIPENDKKLYFLPITNFHSLSS